MEEHKVNGYKGPLSTLSMEKNIDRVCSINCSVYDSIKKRDAAEHERTRPGLAIFFYKELKTESPAHRYFLWETKKRRVHQAEWMTITQFRKATQLNI